MSEPILGLVSLGLLFLGILAGYPMALSYDFPQLC